jgi:GTP-binding protein
MMLSAASADFHELGMGEPLAVAAAHGEGVSDLADLITRDFPPLREETQTPEVEERYPRIAVVGRPNVGKSTLVNRVLGDDRLLVFDEPGTTRDSIEVDFVRDGKTYTLVDTAGIRRRGRVFEAVEKFSVVKTLQAIERANVVILVLDARDPIADQDAHIAAYILDAGRALVIAVNKWDELNGTQRESAKRSLARTLNFMEFAAVHYISALTGRGVAAMFQSVDDAYRAAMIKLPTPKLTRALIAAAQSQPPPRAGASRPKLRYAHQGGSNPPRIVVHGSAISHISASYRRYLERFFRETFQLTGTPIKIELRQGRNPYITKDRPRSRRATRTKGQ